MKTLNAAAEPPEHPPPILSWTGQFSFTPAVCPFTGINQWMGCRGSCCRPDLHWPTLLPITTAGIAPGYSIVWPAPRS